MTYDTSFRSLRDEVSADEWQTRVELAACYRLVDVFGMTDLIYNHITARIPNTPDHLLINMYGLLYREITASSLVKIDLEGNELLKQDTDYGINKSGYVIHGAIHKARPDAKCVLHTHTRAGMAVSAMTCGLLPMSQTAIRFVGHIGYHVYEGPAVDPRRTRAAGPRSGTARRHDPEEPWAADLRGDDPTGLQHHVSTGVVVSRPSRRDGGANGTGIARRDRAGAYRASLSAGHAAALRGLGMARDAAPTGGGRTEIRVSAVLVVNWPECVAGVNDE